MNAADGPEREVIVNTRNQPRENDLLQVRA